MKDWGWYTHCLLGKPKVTFTRDGIPRWKIIQWCSSYKVASHSVKATDHLIYTETMIVPVETVLETLMLLNGE